jgi:hypothetical protein
MGWSTKGPPTRGPKRPRERHEVKCNKCGEDDISKLKKNKTRKWGVANICYKCSYALYEKPRRKESKWDAFNAQQIINNGYTVIEGHGWVQNGATLAYSDVHSRSSALSFLDGTVLKRNKTGKIYEVWNKPQLTEVE